MSEPIEVEFSGAFPGEGIRKVREAGQPDEFLAVSKGEGNVYAAVAMMGHYVNSLPTQVGGVTYEPQWLQIRCYLHPKERWEISAHTQKGGVP